MRTENVAPSPSPSLSARTVPPCSSTRWLTTARPRPRPPCRRVVEDSACRKGSKTRGRNSGWMPCPVSRTTISAKRSLLSTDAASRTETRTCPPSGVNFTALVRRLSTTCWSRSGSPCTMGIPGRGEGVGRRVAADLAFELDALGLRRRRDRAHRLVDDLRQADRLEMEPDLAADDAAHVQQVLDQVRLGAGVAHDRGHALRQDLGVVAAAVGQDLRPAEDGVERRAQLVRDDGEELVLQPAGALGLGARGALALQQLALALLALAQRLVDARQVGRALGDARLQLLVGLRAAPPRRAARSPISFSSARLAAASARVLRKSSTKTAIFERRMSGLTGFVR